MKTKLIIISIILLLVMVFACGCSQFMENIGLINPTNEEQLSPEKASPDGLVKVLIGFKEKPGPAEHTLVRGAGGIIKYSYTLVPAVAASLPSSAIEGLLRDPRVRAVELDEMVYAVGFDSELNNTWGVERIGAGKVHPENMGAGVEIGIIDSGVDYTHLDLCDFYVGGYDFVDGDDDPMDVYGHGTHVAGTACAIRNGFGVVGVAPECALYSLRVLNDDGAGYISDVIAAMEWAVNNKLKVVNLSLGRSQDPGTTFKQAFDNAEAAGLVIVAAAGNSGNPAGKGNNVIYPAKYDSVIAVAATDSNDQRPNWSSTGDEVELAAPGVSILSTWNDADSPHNPQPICIDDVCYYKYGSGTSMASPHVAGTAALVWAANPSWSNNKIRIRLQNSAEDIGLSATEQGYGLVDAAEAVALTNEPPTVSITSPVDGSTFDSGVSIPFEGTASDSEDGDLTANLVWTSSIDGQIGAGGSFSTPLSDGIHTITAEVTDSGGETGSASVGITVGTPSEGVTVNSIDPNSMDAGTSVSVIITGSGFVDGAEVTFENGVGPAPIASNVDVADDTNTITATVTAKSGGPPRERVWDVRVTNPDSSSGVLLDGFTVTP